MLDTEPLVHDVDVQIAPTALRYTLSTAIDRGPIRFLHLSPHHESNLGGQEYVCYFPLFRGENGKGLWTTHYWLSSLNQRSTISLKAANPRNSRSCPKA